MSYKKFYEKQSDIFQIYIKNTDQKEILVKNIINKLSSLFEFDKNKDFVFTDIGAGNGKVTIPVIDFLTDKAKLTCNIIEPSDLIDVFKKNCNAKNINYFQNKIDDIKIPKSDFILASHLLVYLDNYQEAIKKIYKALNKNGVALFVKNNSNTDDLRLKIMLGRNSTNTPTSEIIKFINTQKLKLENETISSNIDTSGCIDLNEDGKAIISFFCHKPFAELTAKEIKDFQNAIKKLADKSNKLTKREDYIWLYKK